MPKFKNILIIEDDYISSDLTEMIIIDTGLADRIHKAYNGQEALNFIADRCKIEQPEDCPDLIFLDLKMPVMDGLEFLEEYNKISGALSIVNPIDIVLLTSSSSKIDRERAANYPIKAYVNKPLTESKIKELFD